MVAQCCEYTKISLNSTLQSANCMAYKLYLNKTVLKNTGESFFQHWDRQKILKDSVHIKKL